MSNRNYRELFERLSKCNLPAGVVVEYRHTTLLGSPLVSVNGICVSMNYHRPDECRAALMLIVDALENGTEVRFSRDRVMHTTHLHVPVTLKYRCRIGVFEAISPDEVTAIAECLIAALGVAG